jgi:hypothetical protein
MPFRLPSLGRIVVAGPSSVPPATQAVIDTMRRGAEASRKKLRLAALSAVVASKANPAGDPAQKLPHPRFAVRTVFPMRIDPKTQQAVQAIRALRKKHQDGTVEITRNDDPVTGERILQMVLRDTTGHLHALGSIRFRNTEPIALADRAQRHISVDLNDAGQIEVQIPSPAVANRLQSSASLNQGRARRFTPWKA